MESFALKLRIHNLIGMKFLCEMSEPLYTEIIHVALAFKCLSKYKKKLKINLFFILILKDYEESYEMAGRDVLCFRIIKLKFPCPTKTNPPTTNQSNK